MALPKLNDTPKYSLTIPSSGKKVNYRPYLVKEEKILMMASETGTQSSTVQAIVDTILACVDAEIDKNDLTSFDVEYMFLNLRSKSVGEKANVTIECIECMEHNDLEIDLSTIEVSKPTLSNQIEITDNITLHMSYPNFKAIMDADDAGENSEIEKTFSMIISCMSVLETSEERHDLKDESKKEIQGFIESLSSAQFEKIKSWLQDMPKLSHELKFNCKKCEHENETILQGLDDFF